jgi:hypothetical protein
MAAALTVLAVGCGSFPDEQALAGSGTEQAALVQGTLRTGQPSTIAAQFVMWDGEGRFDGIDSGIGASIRTNALYGVIPVITVVVPTALYSFVFGKTYIPDGDEAKWMIGSGIVVGALLEAVASSIGAPGGLPYMGVPLGNVRMFPEAGLEYGKYGAPAGDTVDSLRWTVGFRFEPRAVKKAGVYGRLGYMFSEMHFDTAADFTGRGPYAGLGVEWRKVRPGKIPAEPTGVGAYVEVGGALLRNSSGDDCTLLSAEAGAEFCW